MINDLAISRLDPGRELPAGGDLRADLTAWAQEILEHFRDPTKRWAPAGRAASAGEHESDWLRDRRAEVAVLLPD